MLPFTDNPELEVIKFARQWFHLVANGQLDKACALLDEPNCYGFSWTPEEILKCLHETFDPETRFYRAHPEGPQFTSPYELNDQSLHAHLLTLDNEKGYWLDYDIPLNGEWSDLTAQFEFLKRPEGFAVVLHDLHVM